MVTADALNFISTQIYLYGYSFIFLTGLFGNTLNIVVFLTKLKDNVCSFYLLTAEITDTLTLLTYVLPAIVGIVYGKNGTESILAWCRLTNWASDITNLMSTLILCLAAIDRYLCSSRHIQLRQWSSINVVKISISVTFLCSFLFTIPDFLHWYIDADTQECTFDEIYLQYASYFLIPVMFSFVPLIILSIFGYKTYRNLQQIHPSAHGGGTIEALNRQSRRGQRLDKQLSRMLIPQILLFLFQATSFLTINLYITVTYELQKSDMRMAIENLVEAIIFVFYEMYTCVSFYIYFTQSKTFRSNVMKLLRINRRGENRGIGRTTNTAGATLYHSASGIAVLNQPVARVMT